MAKKRIPIRLGDPTYFVSKSWTLSFNLNTKAWISFHSYIPNFYIGDNNLFYSGLNSCCSDFEFIAGELPNPFKCEVEGYAYQEGFVFDCAVEGYSYVAPVPASTTSTTSTTISPWPTTTSTTVDPNLTTTTTTDGSGGTSTTSTTSQQQDSTTTTSSTTVCIRPDGLNYIYFVTGHDGISTTNDKYACCALMMEVTSNPSHGYNLDYIQGYTEGTGIGDHVYLVNGTDDCECVPDGWYFSDESASYGYVFRIQDCLVVEHYECSDSCDLEGDAYEFDPNAPTTTTSTTVDPNASTTTSTTVDPNISTTTTSYDPNATTTTTTVDPNITTTTTTDGGSGGSTTTSTTIDDGCDLGIEVIEPVCIEAHLLSVDCGPVPTTTTSTSTSSTTSTTSTTSSTTTSTTTTTYPCTVEYDITDMDFSV